MFHVKVLFVWPMVVKSCMLSRMPTMTFKNDFVVWLYLSDTQLKIYRDFLELDSVKEVSCLA